MPPTHRLGLAGAAGLLLGLGLLQPPPAHADPDEPEGGGGDAAACCGYTAPPDLVVGAPEGLGGNDVRGGYVDIIVTGPDGLDTSQATRIDQSSTGVGGAPEAGDRFGDVVRTADVDGDAYADHIIAAPGEDVQEHTDAGLVQIVFGSAEGPTGTALTLHSPRQDRGDTHFGTALATADFDDDGLADVAVGAQNQVTVLWGREDLDESPSDPPTTVFNAAPAPADGVQALAAADIDGDTHPDLAVSSARDGEAPGGDLQVFTGADLKASTARAGSITTPRPLNEPITLPEDTSDIAAGDIDADGHAEVAAVFDDHAGRVFDGTAAGLGAPGTELDAELGSSSVALGDIDADGHADIAVGDAARASGADEANAGGVDIVYGGPDGPTGRRQSFQQSSPGVAGAGEAGDRMGAEVALLDLTGYGHRDLVAGTPGENGGDGSIVVLYAADDGLSADGSQNFGSGTLGMDGSDAEFGRGLPR
ncbi:hypothetical protein LP52_21800 [Streptomonospora alba]|uniref:Integrin n=1 Tax=Streptomonospora alba TaxID=183763 RepID=A0A0C2J649_9ACTN|nr:VCBS repeat-containing protein [Streptomonospora alba]KIH96911.1 hypothetical protein LP52_21800 [Streptomonospora alba]